MMSVSALPVRDLADARRVTTAFRDRRCRTFRDAAGTVWRLPYGRNTDRANYHLVLTEGRGTCCTKHGLLAALAIEQDIAIELRLGIYEMSEANTPGIGPVLGGARLLSIPEAHCWLRYLGVDIDLTMPPGVPAGPPRSFVHQESITLDQIGIYKADLHRSFLAHWLERQGRADITLDAAWRIREACIEVLSRRYRPI